MEGFATVRSRRPDSISKYPDFDYVCPRMDMVVQKYQTRMMSVSSPGVFQYSTVSSPLLPSPSASDTLGLLLAYLIAVWATTFTPTDRLGHSWCPFRADCLPRGGPRTRRHALPRTPLRAPALAITLLVS